MHAAAMVAARRIALQNVWQTFAMESENISDKLGGATPVHSLWAGSFVLRPFEDTDAPSFAAAVCESTDTVGRWMPWAAADYTRAQALEWFAVCRRSREQGTGHEFGIFDVATDTLVGGAGLNQFNPLHGFCNLGYWVRESWQGRRAATSAALALVEFAFEQLLLTRVEIVVLTDNIASAATARTVGATFECIAKNRLKHHGEPRDASVFSVVPAA